MQPLFPGNVSLSHRAVAGKDSNSFCSSTSTRNEKRNTNTKICATPSRVPSGRDLSGQEHPLWIRHRERGDGAQFSCPPPSLSIVWEREQIGIEVGLSAVTLGGWPRHNGAGQWGRCMVQPGPAPLPPVPHRSNTIPLPHQQHRRQLRGMLEVL